jgi:hypothetical protein
MAHENAKGEFDLHRTANFCVGLRVKELALLAHSTQPKMGKLVAFSNLIL